MAGLLSKELLVSMGVELTDELYQALTEHYEDTLDDRVLGEVIEELDETQLSELQSLRDGDTATINSWLVSNVPQLDEIIEDEMAILLAEIAENSDNI